MWLKNCTLNQTHTDQNMNLIILKHYIKYDNNYITAKLELKNNVMDIYLN